VRVPSLRDKFSDNLQKKSKDLAVDINIFSLFSFQLLIKKIGTPTRFNEKF
jgi:hypothetical protein